MALVYLACFTIIVLAIIKLANGFIVDFIILPIKRNRIYKTQETEDFLFRTKQITKLLKPAVSKWKGCLSIDFREFPEDFYSDIVIGLFVDCPKLSELLETCLNSSGEYDEHLSKLLFGIPCKEFKNEYNILIKSSFPVRNGVASDDVNFNSSEIISLSHFVNSSLEEIIVEGRKYYSIKFVIGLPEKFYYRRIKHRNKKRKYIDSCFMKEVVTDLRRCFYGE